MTRDNLLKKVTSHILLAVSNLDRSRYSQETAYVNAFLGRLDGNIDLGKSSIQLTPTIVNDRGPNSAESKFGADFSLVFESKGIKNKIHKAIIAQAKNGEIEELNTSESLRLNEQCKKMEAITEHYFVLEVPNENYAIPLIRLKNIKTQKWEKAIPFDEYLVDYVIACKHGDQKKDIIQVVADSKFSKLSITTTNLILEPSPSSNSFELEL